MRAQACRKCREAKVAEDLPRKKAHPNGRDNYFKACHARAVAGMHAPNGTAVLLKETLDSGCLCPCAQACRRCQQTKVIQDFPRKKAHPDGYDDTCKACHRRATAERVAERGIVTEPKVEAKVRAEVSRV